MREQATKVMTGSRLKLRVPNKKIFFSYFSTKTYVVGTQKKRLNEHPKHELKRMNKKIFNFTLKNFVHLNLCWQAKGKLTIYF